jgi:Rps23 Pro-64 3,4-dihydroxylase Tpa1-like proline 4-hydroxylase
MEFYKFIIFRYVIMEFIDEDKLKTASYDNYPFPHTIIDNFLNNDVLDDVLLNINNLKDDEAQSKFINPSSRFEYNKYAFSTNYGDYLKKLFIELNSPIFIKYLEDITGIKELIPNDITLRGAGIHRIKNGGYLQLHTDFNSYHNNYGKLDRRINLLIYMNPEWKEEYNGALCLCDKEKNTCIKKILPILNRCVIFNTSSKSIHGHPEKLNTPKNISRQSIAVYYYTKNVNNEMDFEGCTEHGTSWYPNISV